MPDIEIIIPFVPHPAQATILHSQGRFNVVAAGRRFGKTECGANRLIAKALEKPNRLCAWVGPTYQQSMIAFDKFRNPASFTRSTSDKFGVIKTISIANRSVELLNGSQVRVFSAERYDNIRGFGFDWLIVDEAANMPEKAWSEVLEPALLDRKGGADIYSTPKGKELFWRLWERGNDPAYPGWKNYKFSSYDNPFLERPLIEQLRQSLPDDVFKQEILAEFLDDGAGVFRNIKANIRGAFLPPQTSHTYTVGADLAKHADFTVITVLDTHGRIVYWARSQKVEWPEQVKQLREISHRYNNAFLVIDSTGVGDPIYDYLIERGDVNVFGYKFTSESKKQLVYALRLALERELLSIPAELSILINELETYAYEITKAGNYTYNAPPGLHDDAVISLALAVWGAGLEGRDTTPRVDEQDAYQPILQAGNNTYQPSTKILDNDDDGLIEFDEL